MDMHEFLENRRHFPPAELAKYVGKFVAWSPDGKKIIASDQDELRLDAAIAAAGYDASEIVVSCVPEEDVILGGGVVE